jgi:hypothetical protein
MARKRYQPAARIPSSKIPGGGLCRIFAGIMQLAGVQHRFLLAGPLWPGQPDNANKTTNENRAQRMAGFGPTIPPAALDSASI